jgi:hypothetical protein
MYNLTEFGTISFSVMHVSKYTPMILLHKVADLTPDEVTEFYRLSNPSGRAGT